MKTALALLRAARKLAAWDDSQRTDGRSLDNKLEGCHPGSRSVPHRAGVEWWNVRWNSESQQCHVCKRRSERYRDGCYQRSDWLAGRTEQGAPRDKSAAQAGCKLGLTDAALVKPAFHIFAERRASMGQSRALSLICNRHVLERSWCAE